MRNSPRQHGCRISSYQSRGHEYVVLQNSLIRITILVSKGAEIVEFRHKPSDVDVLWHSSRQLPDPRQYRSELATAGTEVFHDHYVQGWQEILPTGMFWGEFQGAQLGVHGEVTLLPWECEVISDEQDEIAVSFCVTCRRMPFSLKRVMRLRLDEVFVRFEESICNEGTTALPYAWGHHPAFGSPFLQAGCKIDYPKGEMSVHHGETGGKRRYRAGSIANTGKIPAAEAQLEQNPRIIPSLTQGTTDNLLIEIDGKGHAAIRNEDLGLGFGLTWDAEVFPYLWTWEEFGGIVGHPFWGRERIFAFEPFSCPIGGLRDDRAPILAAGAVLNTEMCAGFCQSAVPFNGGFEL